MKQGLAGNNFLIRSSAVIVPKTAVSSVALDAAMDLPIGTIEKKTGVKSRFWYERPAENLCQLAAQAATLALSRAELRIEEIDFIIAAGATPEQLIPSNSVLIHKALVAPSHVTCFDIDSTCLSFLTGLRVAVSLLNTSRKKLRILLINAELGSSGIDRSDLESAGLFGDAATCFVLESSSGSPDSIELLDSDFATYSEGSELCRLEGGGSKFPGFEYSAVSRARYFFHMDGPAIFKQALTNLPQFIHTFLHRNHLTMDDIALVVPHQASLSAVSLLRKKLEISENKLVNVLPEYGNCLSASIPMGLSAVLECSKDIVVPQRIQTGSYVLLIGTGAGITMGAILLKL